MPPMKPARIDVYHHLAKETSATISQKLDYITSLLLQVLNLEEAQMADLSALQAEVAENTDVVASAVTLLGSLSQAIKDAGTDPAALAEITSQLDANTSALAEAVAANTPAAPEG